MSNHPYLFELSDRFLYGGQAYYAARYGDYKILQNTPYEPIQYFNLKKDEYEKEALDPSDPLSPSNPSEEKTFQTLRFQLQEHIRKAGEIPWQKKE